MLSYETWTAATNNADQVKASAGRVFNILFQNLSVTSACTAYFYNSTTQPTPGTSTVYFPVMDGAYANTSTAGTIWWDSSLNGVSFSTGIWCTICTGPPNSTGACTPTTNGQAHLSVVYQ
jgi:hypothetical protein